MNPSLGVVALFVLFFFLAGYEALHDSPTFDEPHHLRYGAKVLSGDSNQYTLAYSPFASHMPFSALNALPQRFIPSPPPLDVLRGRFVTILFAMLAGWALYRWAGEMYGKSAALLSLFLYLFDPNMRAHSHLLTTDMYACGMFLISLYATWRYGQVPTKKRLLLASSAIAVSQLAKYTSLFLFPVLVLIALFQPKKWKQWAGLFLCSLFFSLLAVNAGYFANQSFQQLEQYSFKSPVFIRAQSALPHLISPLPGPYLYGLDTQLDNQRTGATYGNIYLFGELRETEPGFKGFPGYFLLVSLFKVPIAVQLLSIWVLAAYFKRRKERPFVENELFLLAPALCFAVHFNVFFQMHVGIRYFLVFFPFLYVFCGSLLAGKPSRVSRRTVAVLLGWLFLSNLSYFPHSISYCNEWVRDRLRAYELFADSNLDWGQDRSRAASYVNAHPDVKRSPEGPTEGRIVVSVNELVGIYEPERFRWLRENHAPSGRIGYSFLVFDVKDSTS